MIFPIPIPIALFFRRESPEDKQLRYKGQRLKELRIKKNPTMEDENEKRILIGYPHLLEVVKEKCPKCKGKMWHDNFAKCWDMKTKHLKACYQCTECKYKVLFDLFTGKFDKFPFGEEGE